MNRLTVIGRIVRPVEMREVGDGRIVMNNALAIPRTFKTDNGQETDFINFVAWGRRAELIEEYCDKGDLVGFDGRIQSRTYQNDEGQTVYVVEMLVDSVHFLQAKKSPNHTFTQPSKVENHASKSTDEHQQGAPQSITEKITQSTNKQPIQS